MSTVTIAGANGRLGQVITQVVDSHHGFSVAAKLDSKSSREEHAKGQIYIDATSHTASKDLVWAAIERGQKVIIATSGWHAQKLQELKDYVEQKQATVLLVPNFSLGSVLATALAQIAAPYFASAEIIETHHAAKKDSPSGTAARTAELISAARKSANLPAAAFAQQQARGEQVDGIPVHSLRQHGTVATQEVRYGSHGESLEIIHRTTSADSYKAGINAALEYIEKAEPALTVGLAQILGISV